MPPSVNAGAPSTATATVADDGADTGGIVQAIEWDGDGDNNFTGSAHDKRVVHRSVTNTGGDIVTPELSSGAASATDGEHGDVRVDKQSAHAYHRQRRLGRGRHPSAVADDSAHSLRVNAIPTAANVPPSAR